MRFKTNFFDRYLAETPLPLALERTWECHIMASQNFQHPILDIGCGEGLFASVLMDEKINVGIDPNAREIERAQDLNMYDEFIECFGDKIPKPDKSFQTIISNSVMEHIPEIEPTLAEAHRLLKDDGVFYVTLPTTLFNQYSWPSLIFSNLGLASMDKQYRTIFNKFWAHYHDYSRDNWYKLFESNGFKVKECFEYGSKAQCLFNDFMTPFCLAAMIIKKLTNRWFLFTPLRRFVIHVVHLKLFKRLSELQKQPSNQGGLIFFALVKK